MNAMDDIKKSRYLLKSDFKAALQHAPELDFLFGKGNFGEKRLRHKDAFKRLYIRDGKVAGMEFNLPLAS